MTGIPREPRSLPICRRFSRAIRKFARPGWILPDAVAFSVRAGFPPGPLSRRAGSPGSVRNATSRAAPPLLAGKPTRGIARRFRASATLEAAAARAATARVPSLRDAVAAAKSTSSAGEAAMPLHGSPRTRRDRLAAGRLAATACSDRSRASARGHRTAPGRRNASAGSGEEQVDYTVLDMLDHVET